MSASSPADPELLLGYRGWRPSTPDEPIDRIDASSVTSEQFYTRYVASRRPCVLVGGLPDPEWRAADRWSPQFLIREVPESVRVRSERRNHAQAPFGLGQIRELSWRDLLRKLHPCLAASGGSEATEATEASPHDRRDKINPRATGLVSTDDRHQSMKNHGQKHKRGQRGSRKVSNKLHLCSAELFGPCSFKFIWHLSSTQISIFVSSTHGQF